MRGRVWHWVRSFLTGRSQRVLFRGAVSPWVSVTSGVPQGSVLGPLLFNLFVNDISHSVVSHCVLFADDILIYRDIQCPEDELGLQTDLNRLNRWCDDNGMTFNAGKSKVMHIRPTRSRWLSRVHAV